MPAAQATVTNQPIPASTSRPRIDLTFLHHALKIRPGSKDAFVQALPFSFRDVTAGAENEFQAVVLGKREDVDLPIIIESANFFKNMVRRAASGDTSRKTVTAWKGISNGKAMSGKIPGSGFRKNFSIHTLKRCLHRIFWRIKHLLRQVSGPMQGSSGSSGPGNP